MSRFAPGDRVEGVSRSGMRREGAVVELLAGRQWAVRPDGCSVDQAVDADAPRHLVSAPEPPQPSLRRPPPDPVAAGRAGGLASAAKMTPAARRERARRAALATPPEHRRERSRKAGLASAAKRPRKPPKPKPTARKDWHGTTSGYRRHGCRCDACRTANSESLKAWRARRKAEGRAAVIAEHGKRLSYDRGCRCEKCRTAKAAYKRELRQRRKAEDSR